MISATGEQVSKSTTSFSGGAGLVISVKNEKNSQTGESKTFTGDSIGFSIGIGLNIKFEIFIPVITETFNPHK